MILIDSSGSSFTWAQAISNNKLQAYLAYYDSSSATASERKYKYAGASGVDDDSLRQKKDYWLKSNEDGNLTFPSVGGSLSSETYTWNKLRFANGSEELNLSDAEDEGWIFTDSGAGSYVNYYGGGIFREICSNIVDCPQGKTTLSPWEGYFIYSNYNNITLIRQN